MIYHSAANYQGVHQVRESGNDTYSTYFLVTKVSFSPCRMEVLRFQELLYRLINSHADFFGKVGSRGDT